VDGYAPAASMLQDQWREMVWPANDSAEHDPPTGVRKEVLEKIGRASVSIPNEFVGLLFS